MKQLLCCVICAALLIVLLPPAVMADTVIVDCSKGDSINKALKNKAAELTIEISGICEEDVQIRRDNVTLRGSDPLLDGIRPAPGEIGDRALELYDAHFVTVENLQFSEARIGVTVNHSVAAAFINCHMVNNDIVGVLYGTASGSGFLQDVLVSGNNNFGIFLGNGANLRCENCTVDGQSTGVSLRDGSEITLVGSTISAARVFDARSSARVYSLFGSQNNLSSSNELMRLRGNVTVELNDDVTSGDFNLRWGQGSVVTLNNTSHTAGPGNHRIWSESSLVARGSTSLDGTFDISEFSRISFSGTSAVSGSLSCGLGGDAACGDPLSTVGGTSNCGQCFKP